MGTYHISFKIVSQIFLLMFSSMLMNVTLLTYSSFCVNLTFEVHEKSTNSFQLLFQAGQYGKPSIGPKESEKNVRNFSEEQLRAGQGVISLQYGSNKGATQSGINFGNTRHM